MDGRGERERGKINHCISLSPPPPASMKQKNKRNKQEEKKMLLPTRWRSGSLSSGAGHSFHSRLSLESLELPQYLCSQFDRVAFIRGIASIKRMLFGCLIVRGLCVLSRH